MEKSIDLDIPENVIAEFEQLLTDILQSEINKTSSQLFYNAVKDLKPKNCVVKIGWVEGKYMSFTCKCEKNGSGTLISEIVKGMPKKDRYYYFLCGLSPKIFYFDQKMVLDEPDYFYFAFKLQREA